MKFNRLRKMLTGGLIAFSLLFQTVSAVPAYADEAVDAPAGEEGAESPEGEAGGEAEGEGAEGEGEGGGESSGGVVPGTIVANNGMYIANSFPDDYLPEGFRKQTVAYQGQNIDLAYMDASNGVISLAYLTDASGGSGDFYLCDTATAQMSDYVSFDGGNGRFIIVLSPGGAEVPDGFTETALSVNGKSVTAWVYDGGSSSSDKKDKKKDKDKDKDEDSEDEDKDKEKKGGLFGLFGSLGTVKAYAGELDLGVGAGAGTDEGGDVPQDAGSSDEGAPADVSDGGEGSGDSESDDSGDVAQSSIDTSTPAVSGSVASPSEFFLVYAMDQSGNQGFYLYDSVGQTYQRYVDMGAGSAKELESANKSAKIRLFIIIGLLILLVVLVVILVNMALSGQKNDDYYDDDDDYEEMKRRVEKKSKRAAKVTRNDYDDDDDYDDEDDYDDDDYDDDYDDGEDVKVYNKRVDRGRTAPSPASQPAARRKAPSQDIDLDDDFSFDFIKR